MRAEKGQGGLGRQCPQVKAVLCQARHCAQLCAVFDQCYPKPNLHTGGMLWFLHCTHVEMHIHLPKITQLVTDGADNWYWAHILNRHISAGRWGHGWREATGLSYWRKAWVCQGLVREGEGDIHDHDPLTRTHFLGFSHLHHLHCLAGAWGKLPVCEVRGPCVAKTLPPSLPPAPVPELKRAACVYWNLGYLCHLIWRESEQGSKQPDSNNYVELENDPDSRTMTSF